MQLQPPDHITPTFVESVGEPTQGVSMVEVVLSAFNLIGVIAVAAVLAGLAAGAIFIWYRKQRALTTIEARQGQHDFFKA